MTGSCTCSAPDLGYYDKYCPVGEHAVIAARDISRSRRAQLLSPPPTNYMRIESCCLGFRMQDSNTEKRRYSTQSDCPFHGLGIMTFGCNSTTRIHRITCGNKLAIIYSEESVPGYFFESGYSFEDFQKILKEPLTQFDLIFQRWMKARPEVPKRMAFEMPSVRPGEVIAIDVSGPLFAIVVWGYASVKGF